jgi:hypothetical protein
LRIECFNEIHSIVNCKNKNFLCNYKDIITNFFEIFIHTSCNYLDIFRLNINKIRISLKNYSKEKYLTNKYIAYAESIYEIIETLFIIFDFDSKTQFYELIDHNRNYFIKIFLEYGGINLIFLLFDILQNKEMFKFLDFQLNFI